MVELFEQDIKTIDRQSSKGNQLKWFNKDIWYKADYTGYEGLAEYTISNLLKYSTLENSKYIPYFTEEIQYGYTKYLGCYSRNFLPQGCQLITLERLFQNYFGQSLNKSIYTISGLENRLIFLVEQTERITGLKNFGYYLSTLITVDTLFLNEDRHTHNLAVLLNPDGTYQYCPIFDNGAALLADTTMDYPIGRDIKELISRVRPKTFCSDFDEQLDLVEQLYGRNITFNFTENDIQTILEEEAYYSSEVKERVAGILLNQRRKYDYLFRT